MKPDQNAKYAPGDVVQIIDEEDPWFGCLMVVTEPKSWGIQGFVSIPMSNKPDQQPGAAFRRPRNGQIAYVGRSVLQTT